MQFGVILCQELREMKTKVKFTKMQGAGNDYIYVNTMQYSIPDPASVSRKWSLQHTGIGSDGLVLIGYSDTADFSMRIFNADGSEAMMCGNASRCVGKYLYETGLTDRTSIRLETLSGIKTLNLEVNPDGTVDRVCVDMGMPSGIEKLKTGGRFPREGISLSMGNPHFVIFTDDLDGIAVESEGPDIENDPLFPDRTNVEFAQNLGNGAIRMKVWERGSGITKACGTGACATAVAAALASGKMAWTGNMVSETAFSGSKSVIEMDGGHLTIEITPQRHVLMTGPAVKVFEGEIEYEI